MNYYMIDVPDNYPESVLLKYDHAKNPRAGELGGCVDSLEELHFTLVSEAMHKRIKRLDLIDSDHGTYLVFRENIVDVLVSEAALDVKVLRVFEGGNLLPGYSAVIVRNVVDCIDYARSKFSWVKYGDLEKVRIDHFVFRAGGLACHSIARCAVMEKDGWLPGPEVLSESLALKLCALRPKGLLLTKSECV